MRSTLKIFHPALSDMQAALVVSVDHRLQEALIGAEQERDKARSEIAMLTQAETSLPARIHARQAAISDLEAAISRRMALTLVQPQLERAVDEAKAALDAAEMTARRDVLEKALGYREVLQRAAEELAPVLENLKELEAALDQAVRSLDLPGVVEVPAVEWPRPRVDDFRGLNYHNQATLAPNFGLPTKGLDAPVSA